MTIRALKDTDQADILLWLADYLEIHRAWWSATYGVAPKISLAELIKKNWHDLLDAVGDAEKSVWVLESQDKPVGVVRASLDQEDYLGIKVGVLDWVYVEESARGKGAADLLLDAAHAWMSEQGALGRQVFVTAQNRAAVELYKRRGYRIIDCRMLGRLEQS